MSLRNMTLTGIGSGQHLLDLISYKPFCGSDTLKKGLWKQDYFDMAIRKTERGLVIPENGIKNSAMGKLELSKAWVMGRPGFESLLLCLLIP